MTERIERIVSLPVPAADAFDWHARPGAFTRLAPPWQTLEACGPEPALRDGTRREFRVRKGGVWFHWVAEHRDVEPGRGFRDVQLEGPFRTWDHEHRLLPRGAGTCLLRDRVVYELPAAGLGELVAGSSVAADLERMFDYRHDVTLHDLLQHAQWAARPRLRVAVSGASGLIGRQLCALLTTGGHDVVRLVRGGSGPDGGPAADEVRWDVERGVEPADLHRLEGLDAIVHLAGENIARRWTEEGKRAIRDSRVEGTLRLVEAVERLDHRPASFVCASAIGYYGDRGAAPLDESAAPGDASDGFLVQVCLDWEAAARRAEALGCRVVLMRTGVVLSSAGGALHKMLPAYKACLGGPVGDGTQLISWIGLDDAIGGYLHALMDTSLAGPVNLTAPEPVSQRELASTLGSVLSRPAVVPVPSLAVRGLFGRMGVETLLHGSCVVPAALQAHDYTFRHPTLDDALRHTLGVAHPHPGASDERHVAA